MRQMISGLVAAAAVMTVVGSAPAMACGGGLFQSSCSPCGYVSRCGGGWGGGYGASYGYSSYGLGYAGGGYAYQTLPQQQYYYVNQGPVYAGPGNFAPYPSYQESAVGYGNGYGYNGGRYANPVDYSDGDVGYGGGYGGYQSVGYGGGYAPRPAYRPWRPRPVYYGGYRPRPSYHGGYAPRPAYYAPRPRPNYGYGYRHAPRVQYGISQYQHRGYGRPLRRMY